MPTAAKLVGALGLALLAYFATAHAVRLLPPGTPATWLAEGNALIGLFMGWGILGARAGRGFVPTIGHALTAVVATLFWSLLLWCCVEMILRSTNLRYDGPIEALLDMVRLMIGYAGDLVDITFLEVLGVGTVLLGIATQIAARRWR